MLIYYLSFPVYESWESICMFFLLALAVISLWIPKISKMWGLFYLAALLSGYFGERITLSAVPSIGLLGVACFLKGSWDLSRFSEIFLDLIILVIGIDYCYHIIPGFNNWKMISGYTITPDAYPYSLYLNLDKITLGLFLIAGTLPLCRDRKSWLLVWKHTLLWSALLAVILVPLALITGYVHWDPKFPAIFILWSATNLLFVCMSEEAFYRGFILNRLLYYFENQNAALPLLVSALLFGINHYTGGLPYIILSTLAGLFYGLGFYKTRRIETSILIHFTINSVHFLFFTYPYLIV